MDWQAQPKQAQALSRLDDEILYGGARGGGKTEAGLAWLSYDTEYPFYRSLVIRKNADDLKDWMDRARLFYLRMRAQIVGFPGEIRFPNGGMIRAGHLKDENAYMKYQGHEYPKILIEELSQIPREKDYERLISSCRSIHPEIRPQVFATTNPDDPGIDWIRERWGIPEVPDFNKIYEKTNPEGKKLVFIPAKLEDNPILMNNDPNYMKFLEGLKRTDFELYEAWRLGNWKGFGIEGSYYRQQIVLAEDEGRITSVPYEEALPVHTWCDLGIGDSFCIGYFQVYGKEWRMIDYDEFEGESLVSAIERMRAKPYHYGKHHAPPDIRVRELGSGKSRIEIAEENGVKYEIVPNLEVDDGINIVRLRFGSLWIDKDKCDLFLKRIRRYHKEFDEKRGCFKNSPYHDLNSHAADTLRYWAVTDFDEGGGITIIRPLWKAFNKRSKFL